MIENTVRTWDSESQGYFKGGCNKILLLPPGSSWKLWSWERLWGISRPCLLPRSPWSQIWVRTMNESKMKCERVGESSLTIAPFTAFLLAMRGGGNPHSFEWVRKDIAMKISRSLQNGCLFPGNTQHLWLKGKVESSDWLFVSSILSRVLSPRYPAAGPISRKKLWRKWGLWLVTETSVPSLACGTQ